MTVALEQASSKQSVPFVHDILIVGAGPCGLAVAARLREDTPAALFTDDEHHRYHWISRNAPIKVRKNGQLKVKHTAAGDGGATEESRNFSTSGLSMLVLDGSGDKWLSRWRSLFAMLEITHLRSPMFFHPDPRDRDGLLEFAHAQGRDCECYEITGCVGKEVSKHRQKKRRDGKANIGPRIEERDRKDYFAPSKQLFDDYCDFIVDRYGLNDRELVQQEKVLSIDYDVEMAIDPEKRVFTVSTDKQKLYAHNVVLAVGAGKDPVIPSFGSETEQCPCVCHALNPHTMKSAGCNVLVVGGGLTAAQTADQAVRRGARHVHMMMRGPLKIKPFDVDLNWMGKYHNNEKASFWSADTDDERASVVASARGGGSIPPRYITLLKQHVKKGRLTIHTFTTVESQHYDPNTCRLSVTTKPALPGLPEFDMAYFATGIPSKIDDVECLRSINAKYPIDTFGGLPGLTNDLKWRDDVPLYITGKFAGLRLGPGAGNLEGARLGAERIAWALENDGPIQNAFETTDLGPRRYAMGIGSRYEQLAVS